MKFWRLWISVVAFCLMTNMFMSINNNLKLTDVRDRIYKLEDGLINRGY